MSSRIVCDYFVSKHAWEVVMNKGGVYLSQDMVSTAAHGAWGPRLLSAPTTLLSLARTDPTAIISSFPRDMFSMVTTYWCNFYSALSMAIFSCLDQKTGVLIALFHQFQVEKLLKLHYCENTAKMNYFVTMSEPIELNQHWKEAVSQASTSRVSLRL